MTLETASGATSNVRYMPVDMEAELSVLSALFTSPDLFLDISSLLTAEDFAISAHQDLYRAALMCDQNGQPVDAITIADALRRMKKLVKVGGGGKVVAQFTLGLETIHKPTNFQNC